MSANGGGRTHSTYGRVPGNRDHRCGRCNWQGRGRPDCPNAPLPDVERLVEEYREREEYRAEIEIDRQNGYWI